MQRGIAGDRSLTNARIRWVLWFFGSIASAAPRQRPPGRSPFAREDTRQPADPRAFGTRVIARRRAAIASVTLPSSLEPPALKEKMVGLGDRIGARQGGPRLQEENAGEDKC
jgi:hypothetical protein